MPVWNLGALNAETDWQNTNGMPLTVAVSGTFTGTVRLFYRTSANDPGQPVSPGYGGGFADFAAPSGALLVNFPESERAGQVQARMIAFTSGTANVRLGNV